MSIKVFWQEKCPKCPAAKSLVADLDGVELYNVMEADGLAEASFYGVLGTPSIIVCDGSGKEIASWRDAVPTREDLSACLAKSC